MRSRTVPPSAVTLLAPSEYLRRIVGMRTSTAMKTIEPPRTGPPAWTVGGWRSGAGTEPAPTSPVAPARPLAVPVRVGGQLDVGARWVGLGERVGVEDPDQVQAEVVHLVHRRELRLGLDHVEGGARLGVGKSVDLLERPVPSGQQRAGLVGVFGPGVGHERVVALPVDGEHALLA